MRQNYTWPLENLDFQSFSPKILRPISAPINYDVAIAAKQKPNESYKRVRTKWASKLRNAVCNGECQIGFDKNSKTSAFWRKLPEKNGKRYQNTPLNWMVFHPLVQKQYNIQAYCKDRTQKCSLCQIKKPKIDFFLLKTRGKKIGGLNLDKSRSWTHRSVYTKNG